MVSFTRENNMKNGSGRGMEFKSSKVQTLFRDEGQAIIFIILQ
jgi:hypothetical protein